MVFACNHCEEQKLRVEKHYLFSCCTRKSLTCQDCLKHKNEEHAEHTTCVAEEQRYFAKGSNTEVRKKDAVTQAIWIQMVKNIILNDPNLPRRYIDYLNWLSEKCYIPRLKTRFVRSVLNDAAVRMSPKDIDGLWDLIEKHTDELLSYIYVTSGENEERSEMQTENESRQTKTELNNIQDNKEEIVPKEKKQNDSKKSQVHIAEQNMNTVNITTTDLESEVKISERVQEKENSELQINEINEEYAEHTKCVTAEEHYSAKGSNTEMRKKESDETKRDDTKMVTWIQMIKNIILNDPSLPIRYINYLNWLSETSSFPRTKKIFFKNVKYSGGTWKSSKDIDGLWDIIEKHKHEFKKPRRIKGKKSQVHYAEQNMNTVNITTDLEGEVKIQEEVQEKENSELQVNEEVNIRKKDKSQNAIRNESEVELREANGNVNEIEDLEESKMANKMKKTPRDAGETLEVAGEIQINELQEASAKVGTDINVRGSNEKRKFIINNLSNNENEENLEILTTDIQDEKLSIEQKVSKKNKSQNDLKSDSEFENLEPSKNAKKKRARDSSVVSEEASETIGTEELQATSVKENEDINGGSSLKKMKSVISTSPNNKNEEIFETLNNSEAQDNCREKFSIEQEISKKNNTKNEGKVKLKETHGTEIKALELSKNADEKKKRAKDVGETSEGLGEIEINEELLATSVKENKRKSDNLSDNEKSLETLNNSYVHDDCTETFSIEQKISDILKTRKSISLKKLEKKVMNACRKSGNFKSAEKIQKKLHKKLKNMNNIEIDENIVKVVVV